MAEPANGNGYKALAAAVAVGFVTGGAGGTLGGTTWTYSVASDYAEDITAMKVEQARNECRLERLEEKQ